jgi:hypothetical protein
MSSAADRLTTGQAPAEPAPPAAYRHCRLNDLACLDFGSVVAELSAWHAYCYVRSRCRRMYPERLHHE